MSDSPDFMDGFEDNLRDHGATLGFLGALAAQEQRSKQLAALEASRREQATIAAVEQERAAIERERLALEKARLAAEDARREAIKALRTMIADSVEDVERLRKEVTSSHPLNDESRVSLRRHMAVLRVKADVIRSKEQILDSLAEMQAVRQLDHDVDELIAFQRDTGHFQGDPLAKTESEVEAILKWCDAVEKEKGAVEYLADPSHVTMEDYPKKGEVQIDARLSLDDDIQQINDLLHGRLKTEIKAWESWRDVALWNVTQPDSELVECNRYLAALGRQKAISTKKAKATAETVMGNTWEQGMVTKLEVARNAYAQLLEDHKHHAETLKQCQLMVEKGDASGAAKKMRELGTARFVDLDYVSIELAEEDAKRALAELHEQREKRIKLIVATVGFGLVVGIPVTMAITDMVTARTKVETIRISNEGIEQRIAQETAKQEQLAAERREKEELARKAKEDRIAADKAEQERSALEEARWVPIAKKVKQDQIAPISQANNARLERPLSAAKPQSGQPENDAVTLPVLPHQPPASESITWRVWSTADGKFSVEAQFVKLQGEKVTLEKKNGKTVDVKLEVLCAEDQDYVKQMQAPK